jgi:hypothetical protein
VGRRVGVLVGAAQRRRRASKNRVCLVSSGLPGNDEAFGNPEPTRRMPSRGTSRKEARKSTDYGI